MVDALRGATLGALPEVTAQASLRPIIEQAVRYLEENRDLAFVLLRDSGVGSFEDKLMGLMEECSQHLRPPKSEAAKVFHLVCGCRMYWTAQKMDAAAELAAWEAVIQRLDELLCSILKAG